MKRKPTTIEVVRVPRPNSGNRITEPFGELFVNGRFVYRFDALATAEVIAHNLRGALEAKPL